VSADLADVQGDETDRTRRIAEPVASVTCWHCKGKGKVAFPLDGPGSQACWAKCRWCNGAGTVTVEVRF
jgi:DnaJ-class molecular chaperone